VPSGELVQCRPVDEPVQGGGHGAAFARGMVGRAVQHVGQKCLCQLRPGDQLIQIVNLATNSRTPLRAGSVQDGCSSRQGQAQPLCDLYKSEPA
jgi:hypothetical protein